MNLKTLTLNKWILILTIAVFSCNGTEEAPTLEEQQINALKGSWSTQSDDDVLLGSTNAPGDWSAFSLTFTNDKIVTTGVPSVDANIWVDVNYSPSGTGSTSAFDLMIGPDLVSVVTLNESTLEFTVTLNGPEDKIGSRIEGTSGVWYFSLTKD